MAPATEAEFVSGANHITVHDDVHRNTVVDIIGHTETAEVVADVIFVIFGMLMLGCLTHHLLHRVPVPYTVWLLLWGLIAGTIGSFTDSYHQGWHPVNIGLASMANIDPHGLLLMFMPILIYGSAQAMDWHIVKKEFSQIFIMATSGVVFSMCITAVFCYYVFPFGWTWHQCFMFGALISATDPVAVVALLKEVGASKRLGTVIEGESLLNDGTAFVLFLIFKEYVLFNSCCVNTDFHPEQVSGCTNYHNIDPVNPADSEICQPFTPADATALFVRLSVGGPLSGLFFGFLMVLWLTYVYNEETVEIFITISGAYITFFMSEDIFGVSGVLSIVTLGFFMTAVGRSKISPRVMHPMETVWEMLEWGANTVIFTMSGVIMAEQLAPLAMNPSLHYNGQIGTWIGYGILLFIACIAIRFMSIFFHFPALRRLGYGMTWQEAVVISWSGLRGAIGLALALLVNLDGALDEAFRYQVLLLTSTVVFLTLVVNGTLTKTVLVALKILENQAVKVEFLLHSITEMEDYAENHCAHLKTDDLIGDPDWDKVLELSGIDATHLLDKDVLKTLENAKLGEEDDEDEDGGEFCEKKEDEFHASSKKPSKSISRWSPNSAPATQIDPETGLDMPMASREPSITKMGNMVRCGESHQRMKCLGRRNHKQADLVRDMRARLLHGVKATYGQGFNKGYINPGQSLELHSSVDTSLDRLDCAIMDWDILEPNAKISRLVMTLQGQDNRCVKSFSQNELFKQLEHGIVLANSYVYAHTATRERLQQSLNSNEQNSNLDPMTFELTKNAVELVLEESKLECKKAIHTIKALRQAYPEVTRAVKTKLVALTVLNKKGKFMEHLKDGLIVEEKDYETIQRAIIQRTNMLAIRGYKGDKLPKPRELMKRTELFREMEDEDFMENVVNVSKHRLFQAGQSLFHKGDNPLSFFIILRGSTKSIDHQTNIETEADHSGSSLGISEMMLGLPRFRTVTATSIVECYEINGDNFSDLMSRHPDVEATAWQLCAVPLVSSTQEEIFKNFEHSGIRKELLDSEVTIVDVAGDVHISGYTYLVTGTLKTYVGPGVIKKAPVFHKGPCMLGPGFAHLQCCTDYAVLIQLPSGIENRNQETVQDCDILKRKSGRAHHNPEAAVLEMSLMGQHQPKKSVSNAASKQGSKHPSRHGSRHGSKHGSQHASSSAGAIRKPLARASEQQARASSDADKTLALARLSLGRKSAGALGGTASSYFDQVEVNLTIQDSKGKEAVGIDIKSPEKKSKVSFVGRASEMMQQVIGKKEDKDLLPLSEPLSHAPPATVQQPPRMNLDEIKIAIATESCPDEDTPTSHALSSTSRERKSLEMADKTTPPGTPPYSADDPASNSGETSAAP